MKTATGLTANLRLRQARERVCFSQEELAERLGTTQVTVSRWECGSTTPNPYYRRKLCDLFGLPAAALEFTSPEEESSTEQQADQARHESAPLEQPLAHPAEQVTIDYAALPPSGPSRGLVGREEVMDALRRRLCESGPPVMHALYGLPGAGKTTLAAALAHDPEVLSRFPDGVLWVGLGRSPNLLGLLAGWGDKLGIPSSDMRRLSTVESWAKAIRSTIGTCRLLLVIDDAWSIGELLAFKVGGPRCCHLATTRHTDVALQFAGNDVTAIHELGDDAGLELLTRLAPQVVASEREEVLALIQSVGGLPLALTLLGRYLNIQAHSEQPRRVRAALGRLRFAEERLRLAEAIAPAESSPSLASGTSLSLQAVIEVSDERLGGQARAALRALSVFPPKPNSFAEAAALAVGTTSPETLDTLIDAGLLEPRGPDRYALHQTVADYARLSLSGTAAQERLVEFYVNFIERHIGDYPALDGEVANAQAALQLARDSALDSALVRGVNALAPFLLARGLYAAVEAHLPSAQDAARRTADDAGLALTFLSQGRIAELRGDLERAESIYEEGLAVARRAGQRDTISALLAHWGETALNRGHYIRAEQYLREGLALARDLDDRQRIGVVLRLLGEVADLGGQYGLGEKRYQEGLTVSRSASDLANVCALLQNLGEQRVNCGNYAEAEAYLREGLALARQIQHKQRISALLNVVGALEHRRRRFRQAEALYQESLSLARDLGHRIRTINALQNLGTLAGDQGDDQQADARLSEALALAREIGHPFLTSESLCRLGELRLKQRRPDAADAAFQEAYAIVRAVDAPEMGSLAMYGLARVAAAHGDMAEAERQGRESLRYLEAEGHEKIGEVAQWLAALHPVLAEGMYSRRRTAAR